MGLGKRVRLGRLFGHPSGRLCSVAVDHFLGYHTAMHPGLADLPRTIAAIAAGKPDAITMNKGVALGCWGPYAGTIPLILQSLTARPDDTADEFIAVPEDAVRLGADAFATCSFVRGATEAAHIRRVADFVRQAEAWDMPVILHTYPRTFGAHGVDISYAPEDIAWAVRCGIEVGVDVIKTPYCGDVASYAQIVGSCPVPLVAAGGPKCRTLADALVMASEVMHSGARGMTIGRNIWGEADITAAVRAFKAVIHDGASPQAAEELAAHEPAALRD
ncbi:MAG: class I fructose-bisphosphate aldolase [Bryobacteraceae bacterium]